MALLGVCGGVLAVGGCPMQDTDGSRCLRPMHHRARLSPAANILFLRESVCEKGGKYLSGGNLREDQGWRQGFLCSTGKGSHTRAEGSMREMECHR